MEGLKKFRDGKILISAGPEAVLVWVVTGNPILEVVEGHIRHGPPGLLGRKEEGGEKGSEPEGGQSSYHITVPFHRSIFSEFPMLL